jgi:hypothetical protein
MTKHTPGPWNIVGESIYANGEHILMLYGRNLEVEPNHDVEQIANAHLIAAAPDLLKACTRVLGWLVAAEAELGGPLPIKYAASVQKPVTVEALRAAIAKATGSTQ